MKLFLVKRTDDWGYDEYDAFVVCAESEAEARSLAAAKGSDSWRKWSQQVEVECLGPAKRGLPKGVILGSYNGS